MSKYYNIDDAIKSFGNGEIPIIIPTFNQPTYAKKFVKQLLDIGVENFVISDNNSTFPPMIKWLEKISKTHRVLHLGDNLGPRVYSERAMIESMPEWFVVTDPDLILNKKLPSNFIDIMINECLKFQLCKVGFAIDISDKAAKKFFNPEEIKKWESPYWVDVIGRTPDDNEIYLAPIDTTFAVHNKEVIMGSLHLVQDTSELKSARIAGNYSCEHMGWWQSQPLTPEEEAYYNSIQRWCSTQQARARFGI